MAATRCTVRRRQKPPYQWKWTDYHDWTDGTEHCRFCGLSRREANSAPPGAHLPRMTIDQVRTLKNTRHHERLQALRERQAAIDAKRTRGWIANALNERERRARELALRSGRHSG